MGCKAKIHNPSCPCLVCQKPPENCRKCPKLTRQHEIPKSIGTKILGLSPDEIGNHITMVSNPCHRQEDKEIPIILHAMGVLKKEGLVPTETDVLKIREIGLFRQAQFPNNL